MLYWYLQIVKNGTIAHKIDGKFWPLLEDEKNVEESNNILFLRFIHVAPQGNMKERTASGHSLSIVTLFSFSKSWPKCDSKQKIQQNCFETRNHVQQQILLLIRDEPEFEIIDWNDSKLFWAFVTSKPNQSRSNKKGIGPILTHEIEVRIAKVEREEYSRTFLRLLKSLDICLFHYDEVIRKYVKFLLSCRRKNQGFKASWTLSAMTTQIVCWC